MSYKLTPIFNGLSLRQGHETTFSKVNSLDIGGSAEGDELWIAQDTLSGYRLKGDKWLHVTKLNGVSVDGWMAVTHIGKNYANLQVIETPNTNDGVRTIISATIKYIGVDGNQYEKVLLP